MKKILLTTAFLATSVAFGAKVHADSSVYRLYNPHTGEHFYTTQVGEKNADVKAGWQNEGIGWTAPSKGTAVYRVYNPNGTGDHYYTKDKNEATHLVKLGWRWDNGAKPVFYSGGSVKVDVAYNPNAKSGAHNYTTSSFEQNSLLKSGWKYGSVAFYGTVVGKTVAAGMNTAQLLQKNLISVNGTWRNSYGETLVFTGRSQFKALDFGTFNVNYGSGGMDTLVRERGKVVNIECFGGPASPPGLYFVPKGQSVYTGFSGTDGSDKSKDRIFFVDFQTEDIDGSFSKKIAYYKIN